MTHSPGMLTDRYELTMLSSWVTDGSVNNRAVFEAFSRRLPDGRRYGLLGGLGRLLQLIEGFRFDPDEVAWLQAEGVVDAQTASYLRDFRFTGDIDAYPEGELYFPNSPVLTVVGTLGECVILETLILSVLNHDTAIASAAARMVTAAGGRPLVEMGSRRTHEEAAIATARAAYVAGFASTSNLAAGREFGVPTVGTAAHAFTLAHESEAAAFASQVAAHGVGTTLLVDTYDITEGIRTAVAVAGTDLGAIRIDSGDLAEESHKARQLLDSLGATKTRIIVTSDLDEFVITALQDAPIDGYGVGTRVATGSGHPTAGMVYKLVAVADSPTDTTLRPVAKTSSGKASAGGRKIANRSYADALLVAETFQISDAEDPELPGPQVAAMRAGRIVHSPTIEEIREHARAALATLPATAHNVSAAPAYITASLGEPPSPIEPPSLVEPNSPIEPPSLIERNSPIELVEIKEGAPMNTRALIIVDVQNDFVEGGSLAVEGGRQVASLISAYLATHATDYVAIAASRDWHDPGSTNGGHFHEPGTDPDYATTWPVHCVAKESGSAYAPELAIRHVTHHVRKGMGEPAYSAFEGITDDGLKLADVLRDAGVTEVDVTGIATDYCVRATVLDAVDNGFAVRLLDGLHAGVAPESSEAALAEMTNAGAKVVAP